MHQPRPGSPDEHSSHYADLVSSGERELTAFVSAIAELYGGEQANVAAEAWLEAIPVIDCYSPTPSQDWRRLTIAVLTRLVDQLTPRALHHAASR